jgi:hypothetical protein
VGNPGELFAELGLEWKPKMQAEAADVPVYGNSGVTLHNSRIPGVVPQTHIRVLGHFAEERRIEP